MLKKLGKNLIQPPNVLGFAAHWAWIWCMFWSSLFYRESALVGSLAGGFSLEPLWTISLFSNVAALAILLLISHARNPLGGIKFLPRGAGITTALGTLLISHPAILLLGGANAVTYPLGAILTGVGSATVVVLWGELFTALGARSTISCSVVALLVGGAVYFMITFVTPNIAQIITVFLPPVSMFFLLRSKRGTLRWERKVVRVSLRERPPFRLIGISLFFGASFGIMKGLFVFNEGDLFELRYLLNMAAIALGSIAIYISMNTFHMDFDHLTYQIALPLMAAGFIFLPLHDPFNIIGTAVHQFGYQYFYIVLWALWPVLARRGDVPGAWIVCWGLASIQSGQLIGSIFSAQLIGIISSNFELAMVSSCAIFVILFIALFALGNTSTSTGWGFLKPIEETDQTTPFERICMQTVRANGLSSREAEVFFMLAKGHNRAHISEKLFVSDETVKTHIKHIYRKVGVHSQQELIDTIEANEQTSR